MPSEPGRERCRRFTLSRTPDGGEAPLTAVRLLERLQSGREIRLVSTSADVIVVEVRERDVDPMARAHWHILMAEDRFAGWTLSDVRDL